jgi:acetylornithine deacetylase
MLLRELVAIDSVNPSLVPGGAGEAAVAHHAADHLRASGLEVETWEVTPGRPNVLGVLAGSRAGDAPGLLLCGHTDTVGAAGMTIPPFEGRIEGDRVYGRGAIDMKAGVAALLEAARTVAAGGALEGDLVVGLVVDEEDRSRGIEQLVERLRARGLRPVAGVIPEPTDLAVVHAHKGFSWGRIETHGQAAHGSDHGHGVDAIALMGRVIQRLESLDREQLTGRVHPLLGRASLHCSLVSGGTELSTYPDRCTLEVERRTLPGEAPTALREEVEAILVELRAASPDFTGSFTSLFDRLPLEVPEGAAIVRALDEAAEATLGWTPAHEGISGWTDAQVLNAAGICTVLFGPGAEPEPGSGGIGLAHAAVEYASIRSTDACRRVLVDAVRRFCRLRA